MIGRIKMTSSTLVYIVECGVFQKNIDETMERNKFVTVISETHNNSNFDIDYANYLTFGDDWEVALVQAYIPHGDSHFQQAFKAYFPNNKVVGGLSVHYNTSPTAMSSASKTSTVRTKDIIDLSMA